MADSFDPQPISLFGSHVTLEILNLRHTNDLFEQGQEPEMWLYMPQPHFASLQFTEAFIQKAIQDSHNGNSIPYAIVNRQNGKAIGSTRYLAIRREHRSLEIGWTWIGPAYQRTVVNTETKYLMIKQAFAWGAVRVELKTDERNLRAQKAIERIGAIREGVLRNHQIQWDGFIRNTVYYSILAEEWPRVEQRLLHFLHQQ
ncbi:MAG: N-acetyltransferase [Candidatus Omnitrophota bacterium]|jgi:RimJ/RimL family protein N-acetyltransferase|nr:MAG: N-acetyltransferase [Candidatus Omnitrophota bacterium]